MYHPETYWNEVAERISERKKYKIIAGDDEPYYRYKRNKFLKLFNQINFFNKKVLEVGSGPGGNLWQAQKKNPKELHGVDISDQMISISKEVLKEINVEIKKIDGAYIPYKDLYFNVCYTSTVLQHNTDEEVLVKLISEMCRVTKDEIYIFERIEKKITGTELCLGRPVDYYRYIFQQNGFELMNVGFLNVQVSYWVSGTIRKLFNKRNKKEGEPVSILLSFLQHITLPVTSILDLFLTRKRDLAMMQFQRRKY